MLEDAQNTEKAKKVFSAGGIEAAKVGYIVHPGDQAGLEYLRFIDFSKKVPMARVKIIGAHMFGDNIRSKVPKTTEIFKDPIFLFHPFVEGSISDRAPRFGLGSLNFLKTGGI
ncbi:MAG: hypothetical protein L7F78_24105 [Syntrophales bacterium LBB04]|nr:hypothetical protein [Syntrophales bacterium LBB04]